MKTKPRKKIVKGIIFFFTVFLIASCQTDLAEDLLIPSNELNFGKINSENVVKFAQLLNSSLDVPEVRKFLKTETNKRFDGDFNLLYAMIRDKEITVERSGVKKSITFQDILREQASSVSNARTEIDASFLNTIIEDYPILQISIPETASYSSENWDTQGIIPYVAIIDEENFDELTTTHVAGFDPFGNPISVDVNNEPDQLFIVVGPSERVIAVNKSDLSVIARTSRCGELIYEDEIWEYYDRLSFENCYYYEESVPSENGTASNSSGVTSTCRSFGMEEWLHQINCTNINSYEKWLQGAPELRVKVMSPEFSFSSLIHSGEMKPSRRKDIKNNWWTKEGQLFKWSEQYSGEAVVYYWYEVDGGPQIKEIKLNAGYSKKDGFKVEASTTIYIGKRDDSIGEKLIIIDNCPEVAGTIQTYDLFSLKWKVKLK